MRVETSMAIAQAMHKDVFTKAFDTVTKLDPRDPENQAIVRRIYASPNPGEALVQWHKRNETLRVVGDDPTAYEAKIRSEAREALMADPEFRKTLVDAMRAEAGGLQNGKPNTITRLPKSLNGQTGTSTNRDVDPLAHDDSDRAVFDSAWR